MPTHEIIAGFAKELSESELDSLLEAIGAQRKPIAESRGVLLVESALTESGTVTMTEADGQSQFLMKIIQAGKGSSGYYPKEVLMRDGPNVFKAGTHVYINHPTSQEAAARPEGDYNNLAGVLSGNAQWNEAGPAGPALYAPVKFFSDVAPRVKERAKYTGASIRAYGDHGKTMREGVKEISRITHAESVDLVTRAGAGGAVLTEAAKPAAIPAKESDMDEKQVQALIDGKLTEAVKPLTEKITALEAENKTLRERANDLGVRSAQGDAAIVVREALADPKVVLHENTKARIVRDCVAKAPLTESGQLDRDKFKPIYEAAIQEAAAEFAAITGSGQVRGMGGETPLGEAWTDDQKKQLVESFIAQGMSEAAAKRAAEGR